MESSEQVLEHPKVETTFISWLKKLLDTGKKNRLINYKPTKARSLSARISDSIYFFEQLTNGTDKPFPLKEAELDENGNCYQHPANKSEIVVFQQKRGSTENALRKLERDAISAKMEKGIWTLFMTFGMLKWADPSDENTFFKSPLFIVPVEFRRQSLSAPFKLYLAPFEPVFNPALEALFDNEFDVNLYDFQDIGFDIEGLRKAFTRVMPKRIRWEIVDESVIDYFVSYNEAMYHDLKTNKDEVLAHPVVQAVVLGAEAKTIDNGPDTFDVDEENVDNKYPADGLFLACEADGSQRVALAAISEGRSLVVDGPPGTGKSQTIANMITTLMSEGKSVLFVCSKAAALNVVFDRLSETGLNEYVLPMYSSQLTRRKFAAMLGDSLRKLTSDTQISSTELDRFNELQIDLEKYDNVLNRSRAEIGQSIHSLIGEYSRIDPDGFSPSDFQLENMNFKYHEVRRKIDEVSQNWMNQLPGTELIWHGLRFGSDSAKKRDHIISTVKNFNMFYTQLHSFAEQIKSDFALDILPKPIDLIGLLSLWVTLQTRFEKGTPKEYFSSNGTRQIGENVNDMKVYFEKFNSIPKDYLQHSDSLKSLELAIEKNLNFHQTNIVNNFSNESSYGFFNVPNKLLEQLHEIERRVRALESYNSKWSAKPDLLFSDMREVFGSIFDSNRRVQRMLFSTAGPELVEKYLNQNELTLLVQRDAAFRYAFKADFYKSDLEKIKSDYFKKTGFFSIFDSEKRAAKKELIANLSAELSDDEKLVNLDNLIIYKIEVGKWHEILDTNHFFESEAELSLYGYDEFKSDLESYMAISSKLSRLGLTEESFYESFAISQDQFTAELVAAIENMDELDSLLIKTFSLVKYSQFENLGGHSDVIEFIGKVTIQLNEFRESVENLDFNVVGDSELAQIKLKKELTKTLDVIDLWNSRVSNFSRLFPGSINDFEINLDVLDEFDKIAKNLDDLYLGVSENANFEDCLLNSVSQINNLSNGRDEVDKVLDLFDESNKVRISEELLANFSGGTDFISELLDPRRSVEIDAWSKFSSDVEFFKSQDLERIFEIAFAGVGNRKEFHERLIKQFLYSFIQTSLNEEFLSNPGWAIDDRTRLVSEFKDLDRRIKRDTIVKSINSCAKRRPGAIQGSMKILQMEANKKTKHMPIRELLDKCQDDIKLIKPCFMANPLNVVEHIPRTYKFDAVIFDEASQLNTEEAVAVISRAKQVIVAGDQKQLPPTNFFKKSMEDDSEEYAEEEPDSYESLLDAMKGSGHFINKSLLWHYRSRHEDLIRFSNREFYLNRLITFPSAVDVAPFLGVEHVLVDGSYDRGGTKTNIVEAQEVVRRVKEYAESYPEKSVGVVCLSSAQEDLVRTELERDNSLSKRIELNTGSDSKLFVKSLENVQGDESDIIIISIGYGPDLDKKFTMNFGPLNYDGGTRRLNVAVTRARYKLDVITSFEPSQIKSENPSLLTFKRYLSFAKSHQFDETYERSEEENQDTESPFEDDVRSVVESFGYIVKPQIGCSGYRIDLGVKSIDDGGKFMLGIECDGATYHSSKVARDRDRLRQEVLEGLGWRIYRIWSTSWFRNRADQIDRLRKELVEASQGRIPELTKPSNENEFDVEVENLENYPKLTKDYLLYVDSLTEKNLKEIQHSIFQQNALGKLEVSSIGERTIFEIIDFEGPVHSDVLIQRIRSIDNTRITALARKQIEDTVTGLVNINKVREEGSFYTAVGAPNVIVARTNYVSGEKIRDVDQTPILEIRWLLDQIFDLNPATEKSDSLKWIANSLGIKRLSIDNEIKLQKMVDKAMKIVSSPK